MEAEAALNKVKEICGSKVKYLYGDFFDFLISSMGSNITPYIRNFCQQIRIEEDEFFNYFNELSLDFIYKIYEDFSNLKNFENDDEEYSDVFCSREVSSFLLVKNTTNSKRKYEKFVNEIEIFLFFKLAIGKSENINKRLKIDENDKQFAYFYLENFVFLGIPIDIFFDNIDFFIEKTLINIRITKENKEELKNLYLFYDNFLNFIKTNFNICNVDISIKLINLIMDIYGVFNEDSFQNFCNLCHIVTTTEELKLGTSLECSVKISFGEILSFLKEPADCVQLAYTKDIFNRSFFTYCGIFGLVDFIGYTVRKMSAICGYKKIFGRDFVEAPNEYLISIFFENDNFGMNCLNYLLRNNNVNFNYTKPFEFINLYVPFAFLYTETDSENIDRNINLIESFRNIYYNKLDHFDYFLKTDIKNDHYKEIIISYISDRISVNTFCKLVLEYDKRTNFIEELCIKPSVRFLVPFKFINMLTDKSIMYCITRKDDDYNKQRTQYIKKVLRAVCKIKEIENDIIEQVGLDEGEFIEKIEFLNRYFLSNEKDLKNFLDNFLTLEVTLEDGKLHRIFDEEKYKPYKEKILLFLTSTDLYDSIEIDNDDIEMSIYELTKGEPENYIIAFLNILCFTGNIEDFFNSIVENFCSFLEDLQESIKESFNEYVKINTDYYKLSFMDGIENNPENCCDSTLYNITDFINYHVSVELANKLYNMEEKEDVDFFFNKFFDFKKDDYTELKSRIEMMYALKSLDICLKREKILEKKIIVFEAFKGEELYSDNLDIVDKFKELLETNLATLEMKKAENSTEIDLNADVPMFDS